MDFDSEEFESARRQVNRFVEEIVHIQERGAEPVEYFREFLTGLLTVLAAPAGAAWMRTPAGHLQAVYQINLWQTGLSDPQSREEHSELLRSVIEVQRPVMLSPNDQIANNPTGYFFFLVPIKVNGEVVGLVEVFQDPARNPNAQHGFFQFIKKMGELASIYAQSVS
ncbi:MAG TPA: hypothetical protein VGP68_03590 [Gemmataceae bacterium]|nr:hypothetical protein [Gemmataceae bacterium]